MRARAEVRSFFSGFGENLARARTYKNESAERRLFDEASQAGLTWTSVRPIRYGRALASSASCGLGRRGFPRFLS